MKTCWRRFSNTTSTFEKPFSQSGMTYDFRFINMLICPDPIANFRHIFEMLSDICLVLGQHLITFRNQGWREFVDTAGTSHGLDTELVTAHAVEHYHIKWCRCRTLFIKAAHMETMSICNT